jgi:hypothetical protein
VVRVELPSGWQSSLGLRTWRQPASRPALTTAHREADNRQLDRGPPSVVRLRLPEPHWGGWIGSRRGSQAYDRDPRSHGWSDFSRG